MNEMDNPQILRWMTPLGVEVYHAYLVKQKDGRSEPFLYSQLIILYETCAAKKSVHTHTVIIIIKKAANSFTTISSYESPLGSRPFYHEPQQLLDRGNSRVLPFIGFFSLVCPSLR